MWRLYSFQTIPLKSIFDTLLEVTHCAGLGSDSRCHSRDHTYFKTSKKMICNYVLPLKRIFPQSVLAVAVMLAFTQLVLFIVFIFSFCGPYWLCYCCAQTTLLVSESRCIRCSDRGKIQFSKPRLC